MSILLPPALAWVAYLAVGENWPQGDEDKLRELSEAWEEAAGELLAISREVGPSVSGVLESMAGPVVGQFREFVGTFLKNLPQTAKSADQLARLARVTAVELQYAKYMILVQLAWMAFEITQFALYAPQVVPAIVAAGRAAVRMILRRLLISMVAGVGLMVGMDVAVQTFQMMMGDRTRWNAQNTLSMLKAGAIGGAIGGALPMVAGAVVPKFADSLVGKLVVGGATGLVTTVAQDTLLGGKSGLAGAFTSGAAEAFSGGGRRFRWQKPQGMKVNPIDVKIPDPADFDLSQLETTPLLDQPGGGGRPGGGGQAAPSDGPTGTASTTGSTGSTGSTGRTGSTGSTGTNGGASGTQQTGGGTGAGVVPAPVSGADTPPAPGADRSTGNRRGDGNGTDRTERQTDRTERRQDRTERRQDERDGRDGRFARGPVHEQPGGTVTLPPGTPAPPGTSADQVPGTAPARPARGLPGFGTTLTVPGSGQGTAPGTDSGPVPAENRVPVPVPASSPAPVQGRVPVGGSEGAGRHRIAVPEGAGAGSAADARPPGDQRPVTATGPGSGSRGEKAGEGTHLESALPQDETRPDGQVPADADGASAGRCRRASAGRCRRAGAGRRERRRRRGPCRAGERNTPGRG